MLLLDRKLLVSLKALALSFWLGASGALSASDADTANGAAGARGRIVVLGDSITAGYGLDPAQAYPALLQRKIDAAGLPFEVVNAGVSGDTTAGGLRRIDWVLGRHADVLIIALGGNDGLRGVAPRTTADNLTAIIRRAREKEPAISVIVAGMKLPGSMGARFVDEFRTVFPRVAAENGAVPIPFLLEGVGGVPALNQPDMIHPTVEGQARIAATVWEVLKKVLSERHARK